MDLPPRIAMFGLTTLPSGPPFIELIEAVATQRDLYLLLLDPSPATTSRVREATLAGPRPPALATRRRPVGHRGASPAPAIVGPPVPRAHRAAGFGRVAGDPRAAGGRRGQQTVGATPSTLLSRVQQDLRAGRAPAGDFDLDPEDRSIQVHSCHGQARQVQVLRDEILHLLADDPTLYEEDIVVLSPRSTSSRPWWRQASGPRPREPSTCTAAPRPDSSTASPTVRCAIRTPSSRRSTRCSHWSRAGSPPRRCWSSSCCRRSASGSISTSRALETIADWVVGTNVRWGLDGPHRAAWGLPPEFTANSWRAAVDRVLMGVAVSDDDIGLAPGDISPLGVEGDDIAVAGRLADLLARLAAVADEMKRAPHRRGMVRHVVGGDRTALRSRR